MKHKIIKLTSLMLVLCLLSSFFTLKLTAATDDTITPKATPTVEIVSFMRGAQADLRSSELLEARVTGYDGNVRELTYKWENTLGTYLYVYNSHNMNHIDGTDGEIEIYHNIPPIATMGDRSYKDSFTGQGYCWASIYGSNTGQGVTIENYNAYNGTIKVTVYDKDGNEIASDTHTGTVTNVGTWWRPNYVYSGILDYNLSADMDNVTIGLFEGDTRNVKDLLGESSVVHITCVETKITLGNIIHGDQYIELTQNGDYYITGKKAGTSTDSNGDAQVQINVRKDRCKFHEYTDGTAITTVYVFKKPTTDTTAYTLTLTDNLDSRCRYFIDGREGVKQDDGTILFDGLTPNTKYTVEVRAEYTDDGITKYVYGYVEDTTKPVYNATVEVYLDGTYDSATHTVTSGTKVNLEDVSPYSTVYAKKINDTKFIELVKKENTTGTYTSILDSGSYELFYTQDASTKIDEQLLTIHDADRTRYLFYNSVTYIDDDTELKKEYHVTNSSVNVWDNNLTKEGYVFIGWKDQDGNTYKPSETLTSGISKPYVLKALWAESTDVYVNITIEHKTTDGIPNNDRAMHNVSYDLMTRPNGSNDYADVLTKNINWNGESEFNTEGYSVEYKDYVTVYTATSPVAENVLKDSDYTVEIAKTGYELYEVNKTEDTNGNIIIEAKLRYAPTNHDFKFYVELDEEAKSLPSKILPTAAHVKVTCWYDSPYIDGEGVDWFVISQHQEAFVTVTLDENGKGEGTYPVWAKTTDGYNYHYRIQVVSYLLPDGTVLPAKDSTEVEHQHINAEKHTEYCTEDQRYHARIEVTDGKNPNETDTTLTGAYFENDTQVGTVKAIISVKTHTVTFEPDGGKFADDTTENKVATKQIVIPQLNDYTVTRDGGYVFEGWYLVENGEITDKTVSSGDDLYNDIILRAKWKAPLTVEGIISVAGYYHANNDKNDIRIISNSDRTHAITVYLQKILPNGYAETINTQKIDIVYNDMGVMEVDEPMGTGNYCFTEIPDDGTQYRIFIQNPNYDVKYQNEPESINPTTMFDYEHCYFHETESNEKKFIADFGTVDPLVADVNAFLEFAPHDFTLHYAVYASKIGEGFRPSTTDVLILYDDKQSGNFPQDWPVITDMVKDNQPLGEKTDLDSSGTGNGSYDVWRTRPDGHTLYDYGVLLQNYTINNEKSAFNAEEAPFFAYYNGSARYSAIEGLNPEHQTQLLTIELQPKRYTITFDVNFTETEDNHVENMQDYIIYTDSGHTYQTGHIWSYDTDISNVIPEREGYKFLGWYDKDDNLITEIDASVHENVTVTAKWSKNFKVTFHANNPDIDYDVFRTYYEYGVEVSGENNFSLKADGSLDAFYDIPEFEYYTHNNYVFKGWYILDENNVPQPINWKEKYTEDTDIYAHWILVEDVNKEADNKNYNSNKYPGYDLLGVQIRDIEKDNVQHYGDDSTGLRFVTVLSEDVYSQINALNSANAKDAEYGYALAKTATAQKYAGDTVGYTLQYKGDNVNGKNTTTDYKYVSNVKCSGVPDHFNGNSYRLYTAVVTFKNLEGDALAQAHSQSLVARSYIRYTDANGLLRTHYNNYTGTNTFNSCSASFDLAKSLMNG